MHLDVKRLCVDLAKIFNNGRAVDSEETHLVIIIIIMVIIIINVINIFIIRLSATAKKRGDPPCWPSLSVQTRPAPAQMGFNFFLFSSNEF